MKTQIIQLEPHDDVISICDKLGWGQTNRILLVWPPRGRPLIGKLDLVRLQRRSTELGVQLALVTKNSDIQHLARELHLPVFDTPHQAQEARWRTRPRRKNFKPPLPRPNLEELRSQVRLQPPNWLTNPYTRLGFFSLGVLALLAIIAVLLPSATVHLLPIRKTESVVIRVQASPDIENVSATGTVPLRPYTVIVEGHESLPASGSTQVAYQPASGQVRFTNLTNQSVTIPAGTIVLTTGSPPVRFATEEEGEVAAGAGHTTTLPVKALILGTTGNLPPDSLVAIEGPLGLYLSATNPGPTTGGSDISAPSPTALDRSHVYSQLYTTLQQIALKELQALLTSGDVLLPSTLTLQNTIERRYDPPEGQPADEISLTMQLEFTAMVISGKDLHDLAMTVLQARQPEGFVPLQDTLEISRQSEPTITSDDSANWNLYAQWTMVATLSENQAVQLILGLPPSQAKERLSTHLNLEASPTITLTPSWWPRLPFIPFRIQVISDTSSEL
ncbi:MAG: baseplate J/gp47 family protein [Chloroflexota bacterium]